MEIGFNFLITSVLLGVGLAMDAFSVSLVGGLNEPFMKKRKMCLVAGVFAFFQAAMPLLGWVFVHSMVTYFTVFQRFIPFIALVLLGFIGGKMLYEGIKSKESEQCEKCVLTFGGIIVQGIATSIDALSVGFTISDYDLFSAFLTAFIIAAVTFVICLAGIVIGKTAGTALAGKAGILGGVILIFIGLEIFITSLI